MKQKFVYSLITLSFLFSTPVFSEGQEIIVSAASSLTDVLRKIGEKFEKKHGVKAVFNFGSSGSLYQQIEKGAPADVFISADEETLDKGIKKNILDQKSKKILLKNNLVLILPQASTAKIETLKDLQKSEFKRIAIGNPNSVPAGRYAEQTLEKEKLLVALKEKFIPCENVRQVLDYVSREETDAGFVYQTDASLAEGKVKVVLLLSGHKPILYPGTLVSGTKHSEASLLFLEFLQSPEAKEIFTQFKFILP
ncbi:molybdate ABC transporter substrate-binding protein [Leptospira ilyithenensis]|uniref:Molybdate ABC transporter substrate-binding protein n=1 Tax=Leptospira ilyithenensis TaxID=2484901 RepID=A0A4R9LSC8_9LEPT|nr:molybdate ABC transporter substrate-binding protein [Leptospira ilyithenensis]TGN11729.1 molybdate ABC transporter substrate-binding protein [Leptospira ilyithenensis]